MSNAEAPFSVTVRSPKGNLITVRGDTASEWVSHLNAAGSSGALGVIAQIENSLSGEVNPPAGAPPSAPVTPPPSSPPQQSPAQNQGSLNPVCPTCGGPTEEKTGNSARGQWRGYFCRNSTMENKHQVVWA